MLLLSKLVHVFTGILCLIKGFQSFYVAIHSTGSFQKRTTLYFSSADDNRYHLVITPYSQIDNFPNNFIKRWRWTIKVFFMVQPSIYQFTVTRFVAYKWPPLNSGSITFRFVFFKQMHSWPVWIIQGSKGVQTSHINSLRELLSQHKIVRVKLASDKLDAVMISKNFTSDQNLGPRSELLEVKTKGILFQRKSS